MAPPFPSSPSGRIEVDPISLHDLTLLPPAAPLSVDDLLPILRARFLEGMPYTTVGPRGLIVVNPQMSITLNSDEILAEWASEYRDCGRDGMRGRLEPHLWGVSGRAYWFMRRTGMDQSIVMSGETGSGKSESGRLLVKSFIDLAASPVGKKGAKLVQQIPASRFVLESFSHATTIANSHASRFGRYSELQFSDKGRLVGLKGLEYYLEKSRVTGASAGERNFHVFYYLLAGATQEERTHLHLDDSNAFRYLSHHRGATVTTASSGDAARFAQLKEAFKTIGFPKKVVASICQVLSAILHLGNLDFHFDRVKNADSAVVKNLHVLEIVADFLGVQPAALEFALTNKMILVGGEMCDVFLDPEAAATNRDDLARALYSLVFAWIGEFLNQKLCRDDFSTFISILDFPGPVQSATSQREGFGIDAFCFNLASERLHAFNLEQLFVANQAEYRAEGLGHALAGLNTPYASNAECMRVLTNVPGGLVHIIDDQSSRRGKTDATMLKAMTKRWGSHAAFDSREGDESLGRAGTFLVSHWDAQVNYSSEGFLTHNSSALSPNFVALLAGSTPAVGVDGRTTPGARDQLSVGGSSLSFVRQLFASIDVRAHPKSLETIVSATQNVGPRRAPSTRRPKGRAAAADAAVEEEEDLLKPKDAEGRSVVREFDESLATLFSTLESTKTWHVFCLRPNDSQLPHQVDAKLLKHQIRSLQLVDLTKRLTGEWSANLELKEWWERYQGLPQLAEHAATLGPLMYRDKALRAREILGWTDADLAVGKTKVFLSDAAFRGFEDQLRMNEADEVERNREKSRPVEPYEDVYSPYPQESPALTSYNRDFSQTHSTAALPLVGRGRGYDDDEGDYDAKTFYGTEGGDDEYALGLGYDDDRSMGQSDAYAPSRNMFDGPGEKAALRGLDEDEEQVIQGKTSAGRKRWVILTWMFTWWIPSFFLSKCGGMRRSDVRMAWREKLLINMLIWLLCGTAVFVIAILGNLICPTEYVFSTEELASASYNNNPSNMLVAIRGEAFDLTTFAPLHNPGTTVIPLRNIQKYGGIDATSIFPVQVSAVCNGIDGSLSPWITLQAVNVTNPNSIYHDFRAFTTDSRPDWYTETMILLRYNYRKGFIGFTPTEISSMASAGRKVAVIDGGVYDMTDYVTNNGAAVVVPNGTVAPANVNRAFMSGDIVNLFTNLAGQDITSRLPQLGLATDSLARQKVCLRNLYFIGKVDNRNSVQCQFSRYILLAFSIVMISVIAFKFLAALQFGRSRKPEDQDKFVICQVPCYTEGEESLRNCINSLTRLKYDDKRKLLFVICDGMIVGSGNDRPTPRIVLDILGADPTIDPEPLSFQSIGDGAKQHNMAKVYSGLHEAAGHIVPYIVIVKVGKPTERSRPGNRGKRDSQMLLMRFLNRVHFDSPMSPCELEMYHQIKNVIGVNPSFYEYLFMVDADTVVDPYSLNFLIGAFVQDKKIIGLCGETSLSNAKASWTTMMQVYEYFISHYLAKAFESLFGSVTCLPGCFSVYRIRTVELKPLIISNEIVKEYGQNKVETLHVKNLLSLGEDRYLTTIMMKEYPEFKMAFCREALAQTIAPDDWKVLMSQRRRWINSTVHNLAELLFVDRMCGFCCFSMRFVVFIDLASTLIAPVTVAYIGYLIYLVAAEHKPVPTTALIMLGAIYGLQAIIYILHRKFEHIGWMIVYILAIPLFSFVLPLASFWQMDNFSWGSTREIVGEKGQKIVVHDEGKFDPASIPLKSWQDFENELWEQGSNQSIGSLIAASKREEDQSRYGRDSAYGAPSMAGFDSPRRSLAYDRQSSQLGNHSRGGSAQYLGQSGSQFGDGSPRNSGFFAAHERSGSNLALDEFGRSGSAMGFAGQQSRSQSPGPRGFGQLPPDHIIINDIQTILSSANLQTLTKKGVRQELEAMYGCSLGEKKGMVNNTIEAALGLA